jgi:hypothetical protein
MKDGRITYDRDWARATFSFKKKSGRWILVAIDGSMPR